MNTSAVPISEYNDYIQSANTLFHFMKKSTYLIDILKKRAIIPRFCIENIEYLDIKNKEGNSFHQIGVLQKCFCDIPFHNLTATFNVDGIGTNFQELTESEKKELTYNRSHPDYYGQYAIAFSKIWGEQNNLQPVQYITKNSSYIKTLVQSLTYALNEDNIADFYVNDLINRLCYIKPLHGPMNRILERKDKPSITIKLIKNFHDEREWRYVPDQQILSKLRLDPIIANKYILNNQENISKINCSLESPYYTELWLSFKYDEIRYIIVPDKQSRKDIINAILALSNDNFAVPELAMDEKYILISKILVLEEIRKDW